LLGLSGPDLTRGSLIEWPWVSVGIS